MQARLLLLEHFGDNLVQLQAIRLDAEQGFTVIAAKNHVIAAAGNV